MSKLCPVLKKWNRIENTRVYVPHIVGLNVVSLNFCFSCVLMCVHLSCIEMSNVFSARCCTQKYLGSIALKKCLWNILCSIRVLYFGSFYRSVRLGRHLTSISSGMTYKWVWHTSGVCIRKRPHSLTDQPKSHRNKCVTVIILFISVFQRKKLRSGNTHNACIRQQEGRPEHISGHWMWRMAKICLLMVRAG